ncbi:MAG: hypothetical protein ACM359_09715 [Bacillota bacterium]
MRRPLLRVLFLLLCALLLIYGLRWEQHEVLPLAKDPAQPLGLQHITGPGFVQGATVDAYMRKDGQLYDVYSLSNGPLSEKDCKT